MIGPNPTQDDGVGDGVAVSLGVGDGVAVDVGVREGVAVGTAVAVAVDVPVGVAVDVPVGDAMAVAAVVGVAVEVVAGVSVSVGVLPGVPVAMPVDVAVAVPVGGIDELGVAVPVRVAVRVGVGVSVGIVVELGVAVPVGVVIMVRPGADFGVNVPLAAVAVSGSPAVGVLLGAAVGVMESAGVFVGVAVPCDPCIPVQYVAVLEYHVAAPCAIMVPWPGSGVCAVDAVGRGEAALSCCRTRPVCRAIAAKRAGCEVPKLANKAAPAANEVTITPLQTNRFIGITSIVPWVVPVRCASLGNAPGRCDERGGGNGSYSKPCSVAFYVEQRANGRAYSRFALMRGLIPVRAPLPPAHAAWSDKGNLPSSTSPAWEAVMERPCGAARHAGLHVAMSRRWRVGFALPPGAYVTVIVSR